MNSHILIVEDEPKLAQLLAEYLAEEGYRTKTLTDGSRAVEEILHDRPMLVLLDLMLPVKDGLTICREVRASSDVPIVMVTARVEEIDLLIGLEIGADDYICKPFRPREVVARVRTILRRVSRELTSSDGVQSAERRRLHYKDIDLDLERWKCSRQEQSIELTPIELRLLATLMEHPGVVFSRERLMDSCYDDHRVVSDRTIDSHVKNLRRKVQLEGEELIHSIYGLGYKID